MSNVFHRHCHHYLPTVAGGKGVYLFDDNGHRYLDACGGAAVSNLGHNHPDIQQALHQQIEQISYAHSGFFTSEASEALARWLVARMPSDYQKAYWVSGGSEAVEASLKLARQYFVECGLKSKTQVIARLQSYHGNTLGALSAGGNAWRKAPFHPLLRETHYIEPCYAYRLQRKEESNWEYGQRSAQQLEDKILALGADNVMAFIAEPVVGATAGAVPAVEGYFKRIAEICRRYQVLLIFDEVMTGVGRCGSWFAFEQEGVEPDIVCTAKGLAGGYQPIGAVIPKTYLYDKIAQGTGFFQHGHTFMAHPMACAAALATLKAIERHDLICQVQQRGTYLLAQLKRKLAHKPYVGDIRGRGLLLAIELVGDQKTKQPLATSEPLARKLQEQGMRNGLMCYPMVGTIDGVNGHHILLAPPFVITEQECDRLVELLELTLEQVIPLVMESSY